MYEPVPVRCVAVCRYKTMRWADPPYKESSEMGKFDLTPYRVQCKAEHLIPWDTDQRLH